MHNSFANKWVTQKIKDHKWNDEASNTTKQKMNWFFNGVFVFCQRMPPMLDCLVPEPLSRKHDGFLTLAGVRESNDLLASRHQSYAYRRKCEQRKHKHLVRLSRSSTFTKCSIVGKIWLLSLLETNCYIWRDCPPHFCSRGVIKMTGT